MSETAYLLKLHRAGKISDEALSRGLESLDVPAKPKMSRETKENLKRAKAAAKAIVTAAAVMAVAAEEKKAVAEEKKRAPKKTKAATKKEKARVAREERKWEKFLDETIAGARRVIEDAEQPISVDEYIAGREFERMMRMPRLLKWRPWLPNTGPTCSCPRKMMGTLG